MTNCCTLFLFIKQKRIQKKKGQKRNWADTKTWCASTHKLWLPFFHFSTTYLLVTEKNKGSRPDEDGRQKKLQCFKCYDDLNSRLQRHVPALTYREFSNERTRVERRETFRKLRMKENFSKAFEGYFQWIIRAGENRSTTKQPLLAVLFVCHCPTTIL